jgi:hypothetical protein
MNTNRFWRILKLAGLVGCANAMPQVHAQIYSISWHTIDGGGGVSGGGSFGLRGTIGQSDAGAMAGGGFSLNGGFWSWAGDTFSSPLLRIQRLGNNVLIAWPNPSLGFELEESGSVTGSWSNAGQTPSVVGAEKQVTFPAGPATRFYRLRKP